MFSVLRLTCLTASLFLFVARADAASMYTITDLGTQPSTSQSVATAINDNGQVVGYASNSIDLGLRPQASFSSFLYSDGKLTTINPIGGGEATGINNAGQVVGSRFLINNSGQIVGPSYPIPVMVTNNGVTTTEQGLFAPSGFNDAGTMAGFYQAPGSTAAQYDAATYQNGHLFDIAKTLGITSFSQALAIDRAGNVLLDYTNGPGVSYLIRKADGTTQTVLGVNGPGRITMNDLGQVVGNYGLFSNGQFTPLSDLIPPSSQSLWRFLSPAAINDEGQIVGTGTINSEHHAFLMTPVATPEPATLATLSASILSASLCKWTKRRKRA